MIHYMDTDSLKLTCDRSVDVKKLLPFGKAFGQFDDEVTKGYEFVSMITLGPKSYMEYEEKKNMTNITEKFNLKAKGVYKGNLPATRKTYEQLEEMVHQTTHHTGPSLEVHGPPQLQRSKGYVYVKMDSNGVEVPTSKLISVTTSKRYLPIKSDGSSYRRTFPFGWCEN